MGRSAISRSTATSCSFSSFAPSGGAGAAANIIRQRRRSASSGRDVLRRTCTTASMSCVGSDGTSFQPLGISLSVMSVFPLAAKHEPQAQVGDCPLRLRASKTLLAVRESDPRELYAGLSDDLPERKESDDEKDHVTTPFVRIRLG